MLSLFTLFIKLCRVTPGPGLLPSPSFPLPNNSPLNITILFPRTKMALSIFFLLLLPSMADFHVRRIGSTSDVVNFDTLPTNHPKEKKVSLKVEEGGGYTLRIGDDINISDEQLIAVEVARTSDRGLTIGLFSVSPEPVKIEVSVLGGNYSEAYALLFTSLPPKIGLKHRLEAAIADLKAISFDDQGVDISRPWIFSCHDDAQTAEYLAAQALNSLGTSTPPVAELMENGLFGIHHFVQTSLPPDGGIAARFNSNCIGEDSDSSSAGCVPFNDYIGKTYRVMRQCMLNVLTQSKSIDEIVAAEWAHTSKGTTPERESGKKGGPKSQIRGTFASKEEFAIVLKRFIVTRISQKLSWLSWNARWARPSTTAERVVAPTRQLEIATWKEDVRKNIGRTTALRGNAVKSSSHPFQHLENVLAADVLEGLSSCVNDAKRPLLLKYQLRCYPTQVDIPGVVTNGLSDDIASYDEPHHVKHSCPGIHPTCAKIGVELLLHRFAVHRFAMFSSLGLGTLSGRPSWNSCINLQQGNCRFFSGCWAKSTRRVCGAIAGCCPNEEAYNACAADPSSRACKDSVCPENHGKSTSLADQKLLRQN